VKRIKANRWWGKKNRGAEAQGMAIRGVFFESLRFSDEKFPLIFSSAVFS